MRIRMQDLLMYTAFALASTACAPPPASRPVKIMVLDDGIRPRDILLADEIAAAREPTAYDALAHLRPEFVRVRTVSRINDASVPWIAIERREAQANGAFLPTEHSFTPSVAIGNEPPQPLEILKNIPARNIAAIQYLEARDVMIRYGTQYRAGILLVYLKPD